MKKSLMLMLALALVSIGATEALAEGSSCSHGSAGMHYGPTGSHYGSTGLHYGPTGSHQGGPLGGPAAPDLCVENYYAPRSINPCEQYYSPRKCVHPDEASTTQGPYYDNNSNEWVARKLMRGVTNVTMAVGEIPAGAFREAYATSPVTGAVVGGVHGVGTAIKRIGIGVYEILTFPFALNMKQTGEQYPGSGEYVHMASADSSEHAHMASADAARWDEWGWGTLEGVDSCCNVTRGTFAPYMDPEIVFMDALPSCGETADLCEHTHHSCEHTHDEVQEVGHSTQWNPSR